MNYLFPQVEISSFLGVKLGESYNEVQCAVSDLAESREFKENEIKLHGVDFLGIKWGLVLFTFNESKLTECLFHHFESHNQGPYENSSNNYINQEYANIFNDIVSKFILKYSQPKAMLPYNYTWVDKYGNSLNVYFNFYTESFHYPGTGEVRYMNDVVPHITYKSQISNTNY